MIIKVQFEMSDTLEGTMKLLTVKRGRELLHEHLCLALHEGNVDSIDWLIIHLVDITLINQED